MKTVYTLINKSLNTNLNIDFLSLNDIDSLRLELYRIVDFYGLSNISYFCIDDAALKTKEPVVISTYTEQWQNFYRKNDLYLHDPVLYQTFTNLLPTDWRSFCFLKTKAKNVLSIAQEFKIGDFGLSIPIRGPIAERAILSITYNGDEKSWDCLKAANLKDFILLSQLIHAASIRLASGEGAEKISEYEINLSPRELHCLYWASQGKTAYETAMIMGISQNTVRAYIESARHNLNSVSVTQAVSKAIQYNLMPIFLKS